MLIHLRGRGIDDLRQVPTPEQLAPPGRSHGALRLGASCADAHRLAMADRAHRVGELVARLPSRRARATSIRAWRRTASTCARCATAITLRRDKTTADLEAHGHQELLNWHILLGAMSELGRTVDEVRFMESWIHERRQGVRVFRP